MRAHHRDFVYESDVDSSECILEKFNHLRHASGRHRDHLGHAAAIEQGSHIGTDGRDTRNNLGDAFRVVNRIAWIDAFGRIGEKEVFADSK